MKLFIYYVLYLLITRTVIPCLLLYFFITHEDLAMLFGSAGIGLGFAYIISLKYKKKDNE